MTFSPFDIAGAANPPLTRIKSQKELDEEKRLSGWRLSTYTLMDMVEMFMPYPRLWDDEWLTIKDRSKLFEIRPDLDPRRSPHDHGRAIDLSVGYYDELELYSLADAPKPYAYTRDGRVILHGRSYKGADGVVRPVEHIRIETKWDWDFGEELGGLTGLVVDSTLNRHQRRKAKSNKPDAKALPWYRKKP